MKMSRSATGWMLLAVCVCATPLSAQTTIKSGASEIEIGGRVQTQFNTTSVDAEPSSEWLLRRVRLEAKVRVNEVVSGKVQPDFAGDRVSVKDAYLKLDFDPAFQLLAGKAHRPFSLIEQTSSTRILPIERGAVVRGIRTQDQHVLVNSLRYSDRDIGLQVMGAPEGAPLGFGYQLGVFAGPLQGRTGSESSSQYAARVTVQPLPALKLGAAWSRRSFAREVAGSAGRYELRGGDAFEVDAELGSYAPGLHLLGELSVGDADPFRGTDFFGAQGWLGYRTGAVSRVVSAVEPILRVSYGDLRGGAAGAAPAPGGGTLLTPGINVYLGGLNRVMLNYDLWSPDGDRAGERSFKAQFQVVF